MYQPQDNFWFKTKQDTFKSVFSFVKYLDTNQSYRTEENLRNMRLYGNYESYALKHLNFMRAEPAAAIQNRVTLNIVQSMVDTVVSKITKNKPKPFFLTEGGDWSQQRKAQKLTQFIEGVFHSVDFYAKSSVSFKDSSIFGTGAIKIFRKGNKLQAERVFIDELKLDDQESVYGEPLQLHQTKWIHKDTLKDMFPDSAHKIEAAGSSDTSEWASNSYDRATNMLKVIESWRLPSGKDAGDGKHTICIENCTLDTEEWTRDYFPFIFHRFCLRQLGFWGQGLAEQLMGLQLEINKILRTIQISMHLVSVPKLFVEASSKVVAAHLNNKIGGIIKYVGVMPEYGSLGVIPGELFDHLDRLYSRAYEIAGISQLSAQSKKPSGLDSGKALRVYDDLESERFLEVSERYQQSFIQASKMFIDLVKEIAEEDPSFSVKVKGSNFLKTIKWKEVDLDEDAYIMQVFPTSALSSSPSGRLQDVQELMQAQMIGKEDGMKLLDFPDLKQFYNFNNAGVEDIERAIELMIDDANYQTPEPYQNLQLGVVKMQQAYLYYRAQGAPDSRLELFRRWIEDAQVLLLKATQANEPPPPPPEAEAPPAELPPEIPPPVAA